MVAMIEDVLSPEALALTRQLIWAVSEHPDIHVNRFMVRQPNPGRYTYFLGHHQANTPTPLRQNQSLDHNMVPQLQFLEFVERATGDHIPEGWYRFTARAVAWYGEQQEPESMVEARVRPVAEAPENQAVDVFISHAWQDKEALVRPLADALIAAELTVWYDDYTLKVGDSLRQSIDQGLVHCRHGVVVLSPAFLSKNWPQYELNGLVNKAMNDLGRKVILPIWHDITAEEVRAHSPSLADIVALSTSRLSVDEIAAEIRAAVAGKQQAER